MQMVADNIREGQIHAIELKKENAKELQQVIKSVMFRENGTFHVTKTGMRIIVDDQHCEQAIVYLEYPLFSSFTLREEVNFRVPLNDLTEVLCMLEGNGIAVQMTYDGFGEPLRVTLVSDEDDYVVKANIHTITPEPVLEFDFDPNEITVKLIMKPEMLRDTIKQLDDSSTTVTIEVSPTTVSFISQGDLGKITSKFPSHSELVERLDCHSPVSHRYRLLLIKRMSAALQLATKVSLRIDSRGVLCVQFLIERLEQQQMFIEFFCVADTEDID